MKKLVLTVKVLEKATIALQLDSFGQNCSLTNKYLSMKAKGYSTDGKRGYYATFDFIAKKRGNKKRLRYG